MKKKKTMKECIDWAKKNSRGLISDSSHPTTKEIRKLLNNKKVALHSLVFITEEGASYEIQIPLTIHQARVAYGEMAKRKN